MPVVLMNDKEAAAVVVVIENFIASYPHSCTAEFVSKIPDRIRICLEKQGKKKTADHKDQR